MLLSRLSRFGALRKPLTTSVVLKPFGHFVSTSTRWYENYDAMKIARMKEWKAQNDSQSSPQTRGGRLSKRQKLLKRSTDKGSNVEILEFEVASLLARQKDSSAVVGDDPAEITSIKASRSAFDENSPEIELEVSELSSTGEGLAVSKSGDFVYVVPFTLPGDTVLARIPYRNASDQYSVADFLKVIKPSPMRDDAGIKCKYFTTCSGCQLQMLPYEAQLAHKKTIIEKAYRFFSGLDPSLVPSVGDTVGSPLQYGYRTKLTPHFDGPTRNDDGERKYTECPPIGFARKGRSKVMDIESCPIGTEIVREGLVRERKKIAKTISSFSNGATLLLRENTARVTRTENAHLSGTSILEAEEATIVNESGTGTPIIRREYPDYTEEKTYTSNMNDVTTEYIDDWKFSSRAGSFFQNNNSILSTFTAYIREHAFPAAAPYSKQKIPLKYLLDAYCGSGLFAVTLSPLFKSALGIDIDNQGIEAARINATDNNVANAGFVEADASALFADVPFPPDETLVVIDPPRKGASEDFLKQLVRFGPRRVAYVSCNVHTQARDVGILVNGEGKWRYDIESLKGFDFFPQTGHVEGVAFLNRVPA